MTRNEIKNKLLTFGYSIESINKLLQSRMKPTADKMFELEDQYDIPVSAWRDIKSYLNNDTKHPAQKSTTQQEQKVPA